MAEPTKADQAAATEIARWFWGDDGSLEVSEDEMLPIAAIIAKHMAPQRKVLDAAKLIEHHIDQCPAAWNSGACDCGFEDLAAARKALEEHA